MDSTFDFHRQADHTNKGDDDSRGKGGSGDGRSGSPRWQSWFAVFSPKAPDGLPIPLWDPLAGEIDPQIAESWQAYDIRMKLEENWNDLGHQLKGKLHILCGHEDSLHLNRAVKHLNLSRFSHAFS